MAQPVKQCNVACAAIDHVVISFRLRPAGSFSVTYWCPCGVMMLQFLVAVDSSCLPPGGIVRCNAGRTRLFPVGPCSGFMGPKSGHMGLFETPGRLTKTMTKTTARALADAAAVTNSSILAGYSRTSSASIIGWVSSSSTTTAHDDAPP